ncbi:hypothetical protein HYC85_016275 [Camellia sinensis]|uniref:Uncharacterized protein n=1 Tax=Camellia sinensis TaxID=4442 RepID=A0A7J7H0C5_CAMSI|nr:hypothetical protein HYC85_016275 [Camellia sinensis]
MDHKNRWPLFSSAAAISASCVGPKYPRLPKQRKTTDDGGFPSSHFTISSR